MRSSSLEEINKITQKVIMPGIVEQIFQESPMLAYLQGKTPWKLKLHDLYRRACLEGYKYTYKPQSPAARGWR